MSDQQPSDKAETPAKRRLKTMTRQESAPAQPRSSRSRRDSDSARSDAGQSSAPNLRQRRSEKALNGPNAISNNSLSARQSHPSGASSDDRNRKLTHGHDPAIMSARKAANVGADKPRPELGKGRLERGKQISHLGLFPQTEAKQVQRQSTSMQAEAGDQPADLEELTSPNPKDKRQSVQWRKQIDFIAQSLAEYAESHPQFSSQLASCRLSNIVGLKTIRPLKGDQLTLSVTFGVEPAVFDFRTATAKSSNAGKKKPSQPIPPRDQNGHSEPSPEQVPEIPSSPNNNPDGNSPGTKNSG